MRQRVMIAMALVNDPDLIVADEPTAALDVTTQAQILRLLRRVQAEVGSALVLVTHDLGVVGQVADDVVVLYAGKVAERASVYELVAEPRHPYTWGLLGALPRVVAGHERARLAQIPGTLPSAIDPPPGCRFAPRCPHAMEACTAGQPELIARVPGSARAEACILDEETKRRRALEVGRMATEDAA
jgi:oligopeptide/dipeptide ABC transporter ATP-binding protein